MFYILLIISINYIKNKFELMILMLIIIVIVLNIKTFYKEFIQLVLILAYEKIYFNRKNLKYHLTIFL